MLVPVIAGSDKTTVSVATGHQEYHPVYISPGIISNTARRGHGNGVLPVAFLPIPKSMYISESSLVHFFMIFIITL
jgi:Plavaka transposase